MYNLRKAALYVDMNMKGGIVSFDLLFKIILGHIVLLLASDRREMTGIEVKRDDVQQKFSAGFNSLSGTDTEKCLLYVCVIETLKDGNKMDLLRAVKCAHLSFNLKLYLSFFLSSCRF